MSDEPDPMDPRMRFARSLEEMLAAVPAAERDLFQYMLAVGEAQLGKVAGPHNALSRRVTQMAEAVQGEIDRHDKGFVEAANGLTLLNRLVSSQLALQDQRMEAIYDRLRLIEEPMQTTQTMRVTMEEILAAPLTPAERASLEECFIGDTVPPVVTAPTGKYEPTSRYAITKNADSELWTCWRNGVAVETDMTQDDAEWWFGVEHRLYTGAGGVLEPAGRDKVCHTLGTEGDALCDHIREAQKLLTRVLPILSQAGLHQSLQAPIDKLSREIRQWLLTGGTVASS